MQRLLSFPELKPRGIPWCRDHLRRKAKKGEFPTPVLISNSRVAWLETEIEEWVTRRVAERDKKAAPEPVPPAIPADARPIGPGRLRGD
jgi:predicted DNA-binding transcriptional regulator AlpA